MAAIKFVLDERKKIKILLQERELAAGGGAEAGAETEEVVKKQ